MSVSNLLARFTTTVAVFLSALLLAFAAGSCSDEPAEDVEDTRPEIDRDETTTTTKWSSEVVEGDGFGLHARLAVGPSDEVGVAYFSIRGTETGPCDELGVPEPPTKLVWTLRYASLEGATWNAETVYEDAYIGEPPGLDFAFAPDGTPSIAVMIGEPVVQILFCGANDVGFLQRQAGSWSSSTAVRTSGQAATGEAGSDYGDVVGFWPGMAFAPNGNVGIAYKDVHSGGMQSDDFRRADLEFALRSGASWAATPIEWGVGAGNFNRLLFDSQSRPTVGFYNPSEDVTSRVGIWVARQLLSGEPWEKVQLFNNRTPSGPSLLLDEASGKLHVAYYQSNLGYPSIATLSELGEFGTASSWVQSDMGDSRYDEGYGPSLAMSPSGQLAVAYYRCTRAAGGLGNCRYQDDALVFAYFDGVAWQQEVVDEGGEGLCGMSPSLAFDSTGRAWISYRCESLDAQTQTLETQVKVAQRSKL